ncbi:MULTISPECIES: hypothetical protein [unclassified Sphingomonas]|uniref:hypothetical protein n=1 Tax=unclassified Sphingomonas TaxID=196159 RepID=UPI001F58D749|nr:MULTISPECIES: hypothetical protein [unclassified Sphingomonas]
MNALLFLAPVLLAVAPQATPAPAGSVDGLPLGVLPKQELPRQGCAAYLWTASGTRALIAMAGADPARLRLSVGGKIIDLERSGQVGGAGLGFAESTTYGSAAIGAKLTMKIETRESITSGGVVSDGILQLDRAGQDSVVVPVAGLIGCA